MLKRYFFLMFVLVMFQAAAYAAPVTSMFGWRIHPISGVERFHTGTDIGYEYGEPVQAMLPGKVVFAGVWGGYGNCVILEHAGGDHTLYGHMSEITVPEGRNVGIYEEIGKIGSTGYSTGPHLHLEWWHNGEYVDPLPLFNLSSSEAYAYAPVADNGPIEAAMAGMGGGDDGMMEGLGFGFNEELKAPPAQAKRPVKKKKQRIALDYTREQLEQMKQAARQEAVAEAKRQLKAEEENNREQVFFRFGFDR